MVKYEYDSLVEGFRRVDNRGRVLPINITEARRIESMLNVGYKVNDIFYEINFAQKVTLTTVNSFIKNYRNGNMPDLSGDYPAPKVLVDDFDNEVKFAELEERIIRLEERVDELENDTSIKDKVRKWL